MNLQCVLYRMLTEHKGIIVCFLFFGKGDTSHKARITSAVPFLLSKCQTKVSTVPFLAPKYSLVDSEALLGRFAKYTLMQICFLSHDCDTSWMRTPSQRLLDAPFYMPDDTFRFVDTAHLLESETRCFCVSFSKDLTSADETIVFGR